jgi:hypothetical protein
MSHSDYFVHYGLISQRRRIIDVPPQFGQLTPFSPLPAPDAATRSCSTCIPAFHNLAGLVDASPIDPQAPAPQKSLSSYPKVPATSNANDSGPVRASPSQTQSIPGIVSSARSSSAQTIKGL